MEKGLIRVNSSLPVGLKTFLISGLKVKEPHCSCSQTLVPGLEAGDRSGLHGPSSAEEAGDVENVPEQTEKSKVGPPCPSHFFLAVG